MGSRFHICIQQLLSGTPIEEVPIHESIQGHWKSIAPVIQHISAVRALEGMVSHRYLKYAGSMDCVADYKGQLCLIDWKTSKKLKSSLASTFDNPLQVAAYAGAVNFNENFDVHVKHALLVIAYRNGDPADVHIMSSAVLLDFWNLWLRRLSQYWSAAWKEKHVKSGA